MRGSDAEMPLRIVFYRWKNELFPRIFPGNGHGGRNVPAGGGIHGCSAFGLFRRQRRVAGNLRSHIHGQCGDGSRTASGLRRRWPGPGIAYSTTYRRRGVVILAKRREYSHKFRRLLGSVPRVYSTLRTVKERVAALLVVPCFACHRFPRKSDGSESQHVVPIILSGSPNSD